jgi:hypothetical protein
MSHTEVTEPAPGGDERAVLDTLYRMPATVTNRDKPTDQHPAALV